MGPMVDPTATVVTPSAIMVAKEKIGSSKPATAEDNDNKTFEDDTTPW
jgi:hypothetical protein